MPRQLRSNTSPSDNLSAHERWLRPAEAANYLGVSASTLAKRRLRGDGPPFVKVGPRLVSYSKRDLDVWLSSRRRHSTSEHAAS